MTMHPLKHFEDSFDNAQWRKTKQMQCDHVFFDPSALRVHLKSQWRKATKVQPMWLGIFSGSQFEKTLDNTQHGEKQNRCNQCDYASSQASNLRTHFKTHNGEKSNKCDFACIWKQTVEKIQTNVRRANVLQPTTIPGKQFIATSISWGKLYKTALGKGLKIVGKITQFSRPFSLLVTDMDPIHNKPLRSFMCGINHLHMNSTQIKDQIFPSGILFTLHTFISILLDLSHLTLQGWNYLVDRESHSKFTRMRSDSNWFVRAFIRIMSQNCLSLSSNCPLSLFNLNICLHWKKK